ncbi:hypothetical protein [Aromatoleum petrolei]|uniref:Apea-like HEPN domain-containing protein n=1 Tax=Aromatoleum petrolei TaxID=76116 RepID=A0ABX1N0H7_9RHOO|nr:hypothetical protein [Aromatoleum petrolei]NMF90987.1 hypothetical protein [Aromatoleum petrolei]
MQEKLFLLTSKQVARRLTEVFDFVWPTATAIWNLRWQVAGYVSASPTATESELAGRFVAGSGIRGANLRRSCIDSSWQDQQQEFARFLLFEFCSLYEAWCEGALNELGAASSLSKHLQFPTTFKNGAPSRGRFHAINLIVQGGSQIMAGSIYPAIAKNKKNSPPHIEQLLVCYRYFKEARNSLVHAGGSTSRNFISAEAAYNQLTPAQVGLKEVPVINGHTAGSQIKLSLRGVVGFGDIVLRLVSTLDAEFSKSPGAEQAFVRRWRTCHGGPAVQVPANPNSCHERIRRLVRRLDLPTPVVTAQFEAWLRNNQCIV